MLDFILGYKMIKDRKMIKTGLSILMINLCFFAFAQLDNYILKDINPNYRFRKVEADLSNISKTSELGVYDSKISLTDSSSTILNKENEKKRYHGVFIQVFVPVDYRLYAFGYEYIWKRKQVFYGIGSNFSFQKEQEHSSYIIGSKFFFELGERIGLRTGLEINYLWIPSVYSIKFDDLIPPNTPHHQMIGFIPSLSTYFKTKNESFQIIPSIQFELTRSQVFKYASQNIKLDWRNNNPHMSFSLLIKYNFNLKEP